MSKRKTKKKSTPKEAESTGARRDPKNVGRDADGRLFTYYGDIPPRQRKP